MAKTYKLEFTPRQFAALIEITDIKENTIKPKHNAHGKR